MRGYRREVLETVPWQRNSDDFVFDSQFLVQAVHFGFRIGDIPVPVRYMKEASSISFRRSVTYGLGTLGVLAQWTLHRLGLVRSPLFEPRPTARTRALAGPPGRGRRPLRAVDASLLSPSPSSRTRGPAGSRAPR